MESEKPKYTGYGYHGGGRKKTGRKARSITATDDEWERIKALAESAGLDVSRYIITRLL